MIVALCLRFYTFFILPLRDVSSKRRHGHAKAMFNNTAGSNSISNAGITQDSLRRIADQSWSLRGQRGIAKRLKATLTSTGDVFSQVPCVLCPIPNPHHHLPQRTCYSIPQREHHYPSYSVATSVSHRAETAPLHVRRLLVANSIPLYIRRLSCSSGTLWGRERVHSSWTSTHSLPQLIVVLSFCLSQGRWSSCLPPIYSAIYRSRAVIFTKNHKTPKWKGHFVLSPHEC